MSKIFVIALLEFRFVPGLLVPATLRHPRIFVLIVVDIVKLGLLLLGHATKWTPRDVLQLYRRSRRSLPEILNNSDFDLL
jgi:hypothetical protein